MAVINKHRYYYLHYYCLHKALGLKPQKKNPYQPLSPGEVVVVFNIVVWEKEQNGQ